VSVRALAKRLAIIAGGLMALALASSPVVAAPQPCERACLEAMVGDYLTALAAHDPSKLPAARDVRFVENGQALTLGQGSWASIDGLGTYRHIFADPQAGAVAAIVTARENGGLVILDLVLQVANHRITGVETEVVRDPIGAARYEKLAAPEPLWLQPVAPADRISRPALIATADKYFQGMQRNDPKGDYSFFDPDCNRLEHAQQTTNVKTAQPYGHVADVDFASMGCQAQFQTGFLGFVTAIRDRRFVVVDEERQAVFALADLDHNGTVRVLHMSTGKDEVVPPYFNVPRTLQVGEAFRMRGDKIHRIEMTLIELPYGARPAGTVPPASARARGLPGKPPCDRACLGGVVDGLLQAMVDHDPSHAPLAADVHYTENGQALTPGDGLWGTATAIAIEGDGLAQLGPTSSAFRLYFADPGTGQVGYLGAVNENGTPGMMALRVRVAAGKIDQIEAFIVRDETLAAHGGTLTLFRGPVLAEFAAKAFREPDPDLVAILGNRQRSSRSVMTAAVNRAFDTIRYNSRAPAPLAAEGVIKINGVTVPALPAAEIRGRRILVLDEGRGLALAVVMLDRGGGTTPGAETASARPATNMVMALFKIKSGRIASVDMLERPVPFGMTSGWTE